MADQEIEQERQRIEPPLEPLYVDSRAAARQAALVAFLLETDWLNPDGAYVLELARAAAEGYKGQGTIVAPFVTLDEARAVQQPGQNIIITAYGTIGAAFAANPKETAA